MGSIVVATTNLEKFAWTRDLLTDLGLEGWVFKNLKDFGFSKQAEETGTLSDRAEQKAKFFIQNYPNTDEIDAVVGIDDGMVLKNVGRVRTDSKNVVEEILSGTKMRIGDAVINHRAYCFILPRVNKEMCAVTAIKFRYLGNDSGTRLEEGKYPLSRVLGYEGYAKTAALTPYEEVRKLNVKFSKDVLLPIINELKRFI